ncbi:hypothetical protein [Companilactobacillus mishanensis]|uniref:hypothetical protein n=1 Tax=Companilactobacillus mishanensis TaxID=2486008 RepID=UPI0012958732|nr:hypothetical protein [Companilactobacillus mishanensis]
MNKDWIELDNLIAENNRLWDGHVHVESEAERAEFLKFFKAYKKNLKNEKN